MNTSMPAGAYWTNTTSTTCINPFLWEKYRYGYNGKEKDDENFVGAYDFGARIYNPLTGTFHSLDPRKNEFPYLSPYIYGANNPILYLDEDGEGPITYGVHYFFVTLGGKTGIGKVNSSYVLESGIAYDAAGVTKYETVSKTHKNPGNLVFGAEVGGSVGYRYQGYAGFIQAQEGYSIDLGFEGKSSKSGKFGVGLEFVKKGFAITFGPALGFASSKSNDNVILSISITREEISTLKGWAQTNNSIAWELHIDNAEEIFNDDGVFLYFRQNIYVSDNSGIEGTEGTSTWTPVEVISKDKKVWYSQNYIKKVEDIQERNSSKQSIRGKVREEQIQKRD